MRKLILKLIGLSPDKVIKLRSEVNDLIKTIDTLKKEITDISFKAEVAAINADPKNKWDVDANTEDRRSWYLKQHINHNNKVIWAKQHPSVKDKMVFNGACVSCTTPYEKGIGTCIGCRYIGADTILKNLPDLHSRKDKDK